MNCDQLSESECDTYEYSGGDGNYKCLPDANIEMWELKFVDCHERISNCELFTADFNTKCVMNTKTNKCELISKECNEFEYEFCREYLNNNVTFDCIPKSDESGYELQNCSDFGAFNCRDFKTNSDSIACGYKEDISGWELKYCLNYNVTECYKFPLKYGYYDYQCMPRDDNKTCEIKAEILK